MGSALQPLALRRAWSLWALASIALPAGAGVIAAASLVGLYLGLVTWAQGFDHAADLLWGDRYFVAAIAAGFGLQAGLFVYLRRLLSLRAGGSPTAQSQQHT